MANYDSGDEQPMGKWYVPEDQFEANYFVCQSPKVPTSSSTTQPPFQTSTTPSDEGLVCMDGYEDIVFGSGKCYLITMSDNVTTWDGAVDYCDSMMNWDYDVDYNSQNTQLATINSDDENDQLFNELFSFDVQSAWIGLGYSGKLSFQV